MNYRTWSIYFMCMMLSFVCATIGYYQLYNQEIKKSAQFENRALACEAVLQEFKVGR